MKYPISNAIKNVPFPPIAEVTSWVVERPDDGREIIDLCQAVPDYSPAPELLDYLGKVLREPSTSRYTWDEGRAEIRELISVRYQKRYLAQITPENICLTAGCSQAFWLVLTTLCQPGDEIIVQTPYYFDYPMALDIQGIKSVFAFFHEENGGLPSPNEIASLITPQTRAILLVSPSNPTGVIIPSALLTELYNIAKRSSIALILDETYSEFIPDSSPPHSLFSDPAWGDHFIHLTSFGKTYALTGYRAGMLVASAEFIQEALKSQDTMLICQPHITQHAVAYGIEHLDEWVVANRAMMERRHEVFVKEFDCAENPFKLVTSGPFFAWVRHPWPHLSSKDAVRKLINEGAILTLPGGIFGPGMDSYIRLAFGNIKEDRIPEAVKRFLEFSV
ncbi:MAG: aminotransferase [Desulfuromonadaceae bacterium]|nr:aminotransferase [Desulfuromonadaceae bacterium]